MERLQPKDRNGHLIRVGDKVRVVGIPNLNGMSEQGKAESQPVFEYLVGKYKKVVAFDDYGHVQLVFSINSGPSKGWHAVTIEPFLLQLPRGRPNNSFNRDALPRAR